MQKAEKRSEEPQRAACWRSLMAEHRIETVIETGAPAGWVSTLLMDFAHASLEPVY
jgi:hypothetical protein